VVDNVEQLNEVDDVVKDVEKAVKVKEYKVDRSL
jgi:hypothetical protein